MKLYERFSDASLSQTPSPKYVLDINSVLLHRNSDICITLERSIASELDAKANPEISKPADCSFILAVSSQPPVAMATSTSVLNCNCRKKSIAPSTSRAGDTSR